MLRLRALGGIDVATDQGEPFTGAATQRRLLALLAALAVAGDRGLSREKLVALLWPDAGEERARHSLTQALYDVRRALGVEDLFLVGADIRLNPQRLGSDVQELEKALDQGELERALALYAGPFADGFFLPGSREFEQWASAQRTRLEDRIADALDRLATQAEEAGQFRGALDWRKRLALIRPLDTSTALALMTTLASAGDRAGALQYARVHESLLKDQLGLEPDPAVTALVARLREPTEVVGAPPVAETDVPLRELEVADAVLVAPAEVEREHGPGPSASAARSWWWSIPLVGLVVLLALLIRPQPAESPRIPSPLDQKVVVAPFRVAGASSSLAYLRDGLVELLSTRLADDSGARSVDAGAVLAAWRAAGLGTPSSVPRSTIVGLARDLGAEQVIIGNVVGTTNRLVLTATVVDVHSQQATGQVTTEGPPDSISVLVDRLAAKLLVLDAGEDASLASRTTESLPALREFLGAQAAFRRSSYNVALRKYEESLRIDSIFALAALQLARTADRMYGLAPRAHALALASWRREALDDRTRALLVALTGPAYPLPSDSEDQVDAWERLIGLTPDRAESWYELGARLIYEGAAVGVADAGARGIAALRWSLQLDSAHVPALELLGLTQEPQTVEESSLSAVDLPLAPFLSWRAAISGGDSAGLRRLRDTLSALGSRNLRAIALVAQLEAKSLGDARLALQQLLARASRPDDRLDALLGEHSLALNQGRIEDGLDVTDRLAHLQPATDAHFRLRVLDALYGDGDSAAGAAAARALHRSAVFRPIAGPAARAVQLADACVLAQWRLQNADTSGVRQIVGWLRADSMRTFTLALPVATGPLACAELLEAALAVAVGSPKATQMVARLDSLAFTAGVSGDGAAYVPLLVARLHERLGDFRGARDAVRRRARYVDWPRYLATELREEGRYASLAGDMEPARAALEQYLVLRTQPDSVLWKQVEQVREELIATAKPAP